MEKNNIFSKSYFCYLLIFLGLISAFGPFVTDMYLPSLPAMADEFSATAPEVQWGITASLLGLAVGQILFGPLSDKYGRKPVLWFALALFCLATIGDIYSGNIKWFNFYRLFQGIGGAGGIVMSRSIATDCFSGKNLAKAMALIGAINGIAPVVAPVAGGFIADGFGWQGIFLALVFLGVFLFLLTIPFGESLPAAVRHNGGIGALFNNFGKLLVGKDFMMCVLIFSLANAVLFSYISSSPFIVQQLFGIGKIAFAVTFAINAVAITLGSVFSLRFRALKSAITTGGTVIFICSVAGCCNALWINEFIVYELCIWCSLAGLGFIFPSITAMAMNEGRHVTGAASATVGAAGFIAGGIVSPLCGIGYILLSSEIIMVLASLSLLIFSKKIR